MSMILDPAELAAPDRTEVSLIDDTIYVRPEGIDWGDTALELYKAQQTYGEAVVDYRLPNRIVTAPLIVRGRPGGETMIDAMTRLQAKVARLATEGGHLKRVRRTSPLYADIEAAHVVFPDTWTGEHRDFETEGQIVLECRPDFYGPEKTEDAVTGVDGLVIFTIDDVEGNYPARMRLRITDQDSESHWGVLFGPRGRYYSPDPTAKLMYEAEDLEPLDGSSIETVDGASGGSTDNAVQRSGVGDAWVSVLRFNLAGSTPLTHEGDYRIWVRAQLPFVSGVESNIEIRMAWALNDLESWTYNSLDTKQIPTWGDWHLLDLGVVRLPRAPLGDHRWTGVIQARRSSGTGPPSVVLDRIELQPLAETAGKLIVPPQVSSPVFITGIKDTMDHSTGNLTGKTIDGYTYQTLSGFTGSGDFVVSSTNGYATRGAGDPQSNSQRAVGLAVTESDVTASVKTRWNSPLNLRNMGLILRATSNNYILIALFHTPVSNAFQAWITITVGGVTVDSRSTESFTPPVAGSWFTIGGSVSGNVATLKLDDLEVLSLSHSSIGSMPAGGVYIYDQVSPLFGYPNGTRDYDDFTIGFSEGEASLIYPDQSLEIATSGCYREARDENSWGKVHPYGDLPRLPVSGRENRTIEMFTRVSKSDFSGGPDSLLMAPEVQLAYRPCWITVPEE